MKKSTIAIIALVSALFVRECVHAARIDSLVRHYEAEIALAQDEAADACADKMAEAMKKTSKKFEKEIAEIEDSADDEISTLEILLDEAKAENTKEYQRGFDACMSQF